MHALHDDLNNVLEQFLRTVNITRYVRYEKKMAGLASQRSSFSFASSYNYEGWM
jgi:hypothetical protein